MEQESDSIVSPAELEILRRFILRARIVQDHSLARNLDVLRLWATPNFPMVATVNKKTGETSYTVGPIPLLPTEQVESAAARVRPVFLKSEDVHYDKAIDAMKKACGGDSKLVDHLEGKMRPAFRTADPDYPAGRPKKAPEAGAPRSNKELAGSWLYGELIHDDKLRREIGEPSDLQVRFEAAMRTVCEQVHVVVSMLKLMATLHKYGVLELPDETFSDSVTVTWPEIPAKQADMYIAPVETPLPTGVNENLEEHGWVKNPTHTELFGGGDSSPK